MTSDDNGRTDHDADDHDADDSAAAAGSESPEEGAEAEEAAEDARTDTP
ncbi:hypothetical protein [Microbacterium radiodurans]|nr:hypothetical protein [Microbacterium radiodurans]